MSESDIIQIAIAVVTFLTIALSCVGCGKEEPIPTIIRQKLQN